MKVAVLNAIYWIIGLMIGLGSYGHAFIGVRPIRAALAGVNLPTDIRQSIWIVWGFVSGAMLVCALLIIWAWFEARQGRTQALMIPIIISVFYMVFGIGSFAYQRNPFWLLFPAEGALLLAATIGLRTTLLSAAP
jgi:hypothetical protein